QVARKRRFPRPRKATLEAPCESHISADEMRALAIAERDIATFVEAGQALLRIRDERLYRSTHETFEEYCRDQGWSEGYVHELIEVGAVGVIPPELASLPPGEQGEHPARFIERLCSELRSRRVQLAGSNLVYHFYCLLDWVDRELSAYGRS